MFLPSLPKANVPGKAPGAGSSNAQVLNQLRGVRSRPGHPALDRNGSATRLGRAGFPKAAAADDAPPASTTVNGEPLSAVHPNLEGQTDLKFEGLTPGEAARGMDVVLLGLPHKVSAGKAPEIMKTGARIVDLSGDFRLRDPAAYAKYYGAEHPFPDELTKGTFTYGLPELNRVDRCVTCHLGYEWGGVLPASLGVPLVPHPPLPYLDAHPFPQFGCTVCHGGRKKEAGLDLRTRDSMLKGGKSGPALVPGHPEKSLMVKKIEAGQMRLAGRSFDRRSHRAGIDQAVSGFTADFFARHRVAGSGSDLPVLILGMPRSGTTLIEQIIASDFS